MQSLSPFYRYAAKLGTPMGLCLTFLVVPAFASTDGEVLLANPPQNAKTKIDSRGTKTFDRSISAFKKVKSFFIEGQETVRDGSVTRYASFQASLQLPWRAKISVYSHDDLFGLKNLQLRTRRLLAGSHYVEWNSGTGTTLAPLKSVGTRQKSVQQMFSVNEILAQGLIPLVLGQNPSRMSGVREVQFSREKGLLKVRVIRMRAQSKQPSTMDYFFSAKTGYPLRFRVNYKESNIEHAATLELENAEEIPFSDNDFGDQEGNDLYLYGWDRLPNDVTPRDDAKIPREILQYS